MHSPPEPRTGNTRHRPLPRQARAVFGICLLTVCVSIGVRLAGFSLNRWGRAVVDGPMLVAVAFSSIIWAAHSHQPSPSVNNSISEDQSP